MLIMELERRTRFIFEQVGLEPIVTLTDTLARKFEAYAHERAQGRLVGSVWTQDEQPGLMLSGKCREPTLPRRIAGETRGDFAQVEDDQPKGTASKQELTRPGGPMVSESFRNSNDSERLEIDAAGLEVGAEDAPALGGRGHDPRRSLTKGLDMREIGHGSAGLHAVAMARELDEPPHFEKLGPMCLGERRRVKTGGAHVQ